MLRLQSKAAATTIQYPLLLTFVCPNLLFIQMITIYFNVASVVAGFTKVVCPFCGNNITCIITDSHPVYTQLCIFEEAPTRIC